MSGFRDWLDTLFGSDGGRAVQMLFALLIVVLLILAVTWLFRRLFGATLARGRSHRLAVVDSTPVDGHRRLLLVRRDEVEHLVMIGGPNDLLVESRILKAPPVLAARPASPAAATRPQPARPVPAPAPAPVTEPLPQIEPLPPVEEPAPSALAGAAAAAKTRAAAGAAGMVAAVASAGALLRARVGRTEPKPSEPVDLDAQAPVRAPSEATEPPRRTLDEAFDAPLGRPAIATPAVPPPPPTAPEPAAPPVAVEPPKPIERSFFDRPARREPVVETIVPIEPPAPKVRPATRNLDEIDLLADFEAITAELSVKPVAAPIAPPPVEPVRWDEAPVAPVAAAAVEPAPIVVHEEPPIVEPPSDPIIEPKFDFMPPEPEPIPSAPTVPPVEPAPPVEIAAPVEEPAPEAMLDLRPEPVVTATPPTPVDELEEEMARLLAELSGQTRR